ncbi:hypothetical protein BN871_AN_00300 [Paenibacillus sp. P22]|nr:hypothetical protein BN871_AN_00300 [Paenibacillus sp. P22]
MLRFGVGDGKLDRTPIKADGIALPSRQLFSPLVDSNLRRLLLDFMAADYRVRH